MNPEDIIVSRQIELEIPNIVKGRIVARENKNRFNPRDKIFVELQMKGTPTIVLTDTLPMKVKNLDVGKTYTFRKYNLYYNKEYTGTHLSSFCFDRGQEFSEVGKTNKVRYYRAV